MRDSPDELIFPKSGRWSVFRECHARRTGSPRLRSRYRAWIPLTFATWAEECTDYPDGVREAALAHKYKSETTAAYQRGQKLEKRRFLMKDWAQFLAGSNVIRFDKTG